MKTTGSATTDNEGQYNAIENLLAAPYPLQETSKTHTKKKKPKIPLYILYNYTQ